MTTIIYVVLTIFGIAVLFDFCIEAIQCIFSLIADLIVTFFDWYKWILSWME